MPKKTVLVTGATGLLGRQVVRAFSYYALDSDDWIVKGTGFSRAGPQSAAVDGKSVDEVIRVDLADEGQVEGLLEGVKPDAVVHCAANRFPDKVDGDPEGTRVLNVEASRRLAKLCAERSILMIYISTDYVFSGRPGEAPYEADATPAPTNLYGQTKLDGERAVLGEFGDDSGKGVVLRVPILYGSAERGDGSAVNVLMEGVRRAQGGGEVVKMDHWALRYPTNTEDVGRVCHDVAVHYLGVLGTEKGRELPRVLQFSSEDKYTKYEICQVFGEIMGLPIDGIEPNTEGNDPNASVQRPYDCHLSTRALKELGIDVSTQDFVGWWRREMRAFRK